MWLTISIFKRNIWTTHTILLFHSWIYEIFIWIIFWIVIVVEKSDEMWRLSEFFHELQVTLGLWFEKRSYLIIFFKVEHWFFVMLIMFKWTSSFWRFIRFSIESLIILENFQYCLKENVLDHFCTKLILLFFFMYLEKIKLIFVSQHLWNMMFVINIVYS